MIELSKHIESLLLKHDCVIVPGLGGFVTQHVSARFVTDECLYLPPCRSVGFNARLIHNDGLLVQSYMQAYDTTFPEAVRIIDEAVRKVKQSLAAEGSYELHGIGCLHIDSDGHYLFTPCEAGVVSPELYGLDSFVLHELVQAETEKPEPKTRRRPLRTIFKRLQPNVKRSEHTYTIRVSREMVNYVAAAVVAVFFYLAWATPVADAPSDNSQSASMAYERLFGGAQREADVQAEPQQSELKPAVSVPTKESASSAASPAPAEAPKAEASAERTQPKASFAIVMASAITQRNAESFAAELKRDGYESARTYKKGKMLRVLLGNYSTREEAQQALRVYKKNELFSTSWVIDLR